MSRLAHGFGALLEQVQELDKRNAHLEHLLDRMQEQKIEEAHKIEAERLMSQQEPLASPAHRLQSENAEDPIAAEVHSNDQQSQSPSQAGSASKCPIRFLDQHSAEELAEYFKNHSHELPRSHEICVKRYQRNEDQIRQLDHKYGSLVNMIQGLGHKHQSLLHTKAEDEKLGHEHVSQEKVDVWNEELENGQETQVDGAAEDDAIDQREGHFDRPLKEVRVGESPSRPWGISVPQGASIPPSAASGQEVPRDISNEPDPPTPETAPGQKAIGVPPKASDTVRPSPGMVFTGPVFLGYPPDQIAEILQRTGLGKGIA
ncbi:MAG: hypothetical protein LQ350_008607 [Teloschistes chrysophthalmus]|nr:MAG: hypothetical protein LQ350_008607 [Niorma chrysophthalma]